MNTKKMRIAILTGLVTTVACMGLFGITTGCSGQIGGFNDDVQESLNEAIKEGFSLDDASMPGPLSEVSEGEMLPDDIGPPLDEDEKMAEAEDMAGGGGEKDIETIAGCRTSTEDTTVLRKLAKYANSKFIGLTNDTQDPTFNLMIPEKAKLLTEDPAFKSADLKAIVLRNQSEEVESEYTLTANSVTQFSESDAEEQSLSELPVNLMIATGNTVNEVYNSKFRAIENEIGSEKLSSIMFELDEDIPTMECIPEIRSNSVVCLGVENDKDFLAAGDYRSVEIFESNRKNTLTKANANMLKIMADFNLQLRYVSKVDDTFQAGGRSGDNCNVEATYDKNGNSIEAPVNLDSETLLANVEKIVRDLSITEEEGDRLEVDQIKKEVADFPTDQMRLLTSEPEYKEVAPSSDTQLLENIKEMESGTTETTPRPDTELPSTTPALENDSTIPERMVPNSEMNKIEQFDSDQTIIRQ